MLQSGQYADVTFRIGEETIPAHSCILALAAPNSYFSSIFTYPMREQNTRQVVVEGTSFATFHSLLELLYTGQTTIVDIEALADLYCASINQKCSLFGKIYRMADADGLKVVCLYEMIKQWKELQDTEERKVVSGLPGAFDEVMRLGGEPNKFSFEWLSGVSLKRKREEGDTGERD
ncbi:hypothetical protein HDV00_002835 [Rhizophlyctis rosea]|nr:hypothetical protein HDV00_002835 [Rhizophlyctis rosea]